MQLRSGSRTSVLTPQQTVKEDSALTKKRPASAVSASQCKERPELKKRKLKTVRFEDAQFSPETPASLEDHPSFHRSPTPINDHFPSDISESLFADLDRNSWAALDESKILTPDEKEEMSLSSDSGSSVESEDPSSTEENDVSEPHDEEDQSEATPTAISINTVYLDDYIDLKNSAWEWCSKYFPFNNQPLDLLDLCTTSPQLMEHTNYISACTNKGTWEDVFNKQRPFLVYCILGKMLDVHVFGHEMLGGTREQVEELRRVDRDVVGDDGKSELLLSLPKPSFLPFIQ